jgi:hypothetical protein
VMGMVCHVGKAEDRTKLLTQVSWKMKLCKNFQCC